MGLEDFSDSDLANEQTRRRKKREADYFRQLNEYFGSCPECDADLASVERDSVQEHWAAPTWQGWPSPPPEDWHGRVLVGQEFETKLTCSNGHERYPEREFVAAREP